MDGENPEQSDAGTRAQKVDPAAIEPSTGLGFVASFEIGSPVRLPIQPDTKQFPGLYALHLLTFDSKQTIVTYWKSRAHFDASNASFARQFGLRVESTGLISHFAVPRRSVLGRLFKPESIKNLVLTATSIFTFVTLLATHAGEIFEPPDLSLDVQISKRNYLRGEPLAVDLLVNNRCRYATAMVSDFAVKQRGADDDLLKFHSPPTEKIRLEAGEKQTVKLSGWAKAGSRERPPPVTREVSASVKVKAGWLWPEHSFASNSSVLIWSDSSWGTPAVGDSGPTICNIQGSFFAGQEKGLEGEFKLDSSDAHRITGMDLRFQPNMAIEYKHIASEEKDLQKLRFQIKQLTPFQEYRYTVTLTAAPAETPIDCRGLLSGFKPIIYY